MKYLTKKRQKPKSKIKHQVQIVSNTFYRINYTTTFFLFIYSFFLSIGSGTTLNIPEEPQATAALEYYPSTVTTPTSTQLPQLVSHITIRDTDSPTNIIPVQHTPQALQSTEENPLQEQDNSGK